VPIQIQEASRTPSTLDQNRTTPQHIINKTTSTENTERILKVVRKKKQIMNKGKTIKIQISQWKNLNARRAWSEVFQALNENNFKTRILYPAKL
jgi:anthranilate/para-aminobenzoate synthase component I